jgi:hypothetical protein
MQAKNVTPQGPDPYGSIADNHLLFGADGVALVVPGGLGENTS